MSKDKTSSNNAIGLYFVSAILSALAPVAVVYWNLEKGTFLFSLMVIGCISVSSIIGLILFSWKERVRFLAILNFPDLSLNLLNAVSYLASIYLMLKALESEDKISVVLIIESWPIIVALALPYTKISGITAISATKFIFIVASLCGLAIILSGPSNFSALATEFVVSDEFLLAFASMSCMAIATLAKGRFVERCAANTNLSIFETQLFQYAFMAILVFPFFISAQFTAEISNIDSSQAIGILAVALLFFLSSLLFSFGYINSRRASDSLVWFFAPVITTLALAAANMDKISPHEILGMILIVSSNLFLNFPPQKGIAYAGGIFSFLIFGLACYYFPASGSQSVFDVVSTLSIFYVVIVAFLLERAAQRNDEEGFLMLDCWESLSKNLDRVKIDKTETPGKIFLKLVEARTQFQLHHNFMSLLHMLDNKSKTDSSSTKTLLNKFVFSRSRGVGFVELFSLASIALLTIFASIHYRHQSIFGDVFGTVVSFAVVFIFLSLWELLIARKKRLIRLESIEGREHVVPIIRAHHESPEYTWWAVFLILNIAIAFIVLFYLKHNTT